MQEILYIAKSFRDRNKLGELTSSKSEVRPFECHFQRIDYLPLGVWNALHAVEFAPIPLFCHEFKARYFFFHTTLLLSQSRKYKESKIKKMSLQ